MPEFLLPQNMLKIGGDQRPLTTDKKNLEGHHIMILAQQCKNHSRNTHRNLSQVVSRILILVEETMANLQISKGDSYCNEMQW